MTYLKQALQSDFYYVLIAAAAVKLLLKGKLFWHRMSDNYHEEI